MLSRIFSAHTVVDYPTDLDLIRTLGSKGNTLLGVKYCTIIGD